MGNGGLKKAGIVAWISRHPALGDYERRRIIDGNEQAVAEAKKLRLPMDRDFGSFNSPAEMAAAVPETLRTGLFIIRCPHRTEGTIQRKLFATWNQVQEFIENLSGGYEQYRLGLREVTEPIWSGTTVSSSGGQIVRLALWPGRHLAMDAEIVPTSYWGVYSTEAGAPLHFIWSENCSEELKTLMLDSLRYFGPDFIPTRNLFAEFSVMQGNFYRFHGVSFDPYWTETRSIVNPVFTGD